jgi:hypothetical protein
MVYLQRNLILRAAIMGCQTLLRKSSESPTRCRKLVGGWPDYIGVCDASSHGVGGVVFSENDTCIPPVFRWEWPQVIRDKYHAKEISNSDLEMAGLLFLWLVMEAVCGNLRETNIALFSNNSPMVGWVQRLATCGLLVSANIISALALRLKVHGDLTMIAFYYLLRIGKYTTKGVRNNSKQTQEFKLGDITFFAKDKQGNLCCLP